MAIEGPQVLGDYLLIERIGEGGMAEVYRAQYTGHAHSVGPQNEVVVKRIKPSLFKAAEFPIFREMFLNEAKLVRSLQHPNLARMHTLNEAVDKTMGVKVPFIVGEYIRGHQLWELMRIATRGFTGRPIPPAISAYVVREIARGLGHAHAHKDANSGRPQPIIHRDISPENVMISSDGKVKVIDFGVAKAIGGFGPQTQTGIIKGKLAYMAPEQVAQKVVPATDVFGAGIVLHEMLTGRRLFGAPNDYVVINKVLKGEIPRPSATTRGIPKELEEVVMTALSRDLSVRYVDGNTFADALTDVMNRVTFLRGTTANSIKRWAEQTLAEAATIASGWQEENSDEDMRSRQDSGEGAEGEIELTGDDLAALEGDVDPAVRAAVTEGLRTLKPEMLQRKAPPPVAPSMSSRRTPPPPPPSSLSNPRSSGSMASTSPRSSDPAVAAAAGPISAPELAAATAEQARPAPHSQPPEEAHHPHYAVLPAAVQAMLSDPQMLRWLGVVAGLVAVVLLLLLLLLFRC